MADDIAQWLEGLGLGQYAQTFADNDIDLADILRATWDAGDSDSNHHPVDCNRPAGVVRAGTHDSRQIFAEGRL